MDLLLWTHIVSGSIALLSGLVAFSLKKGSYWHKRSGKLFYWSMITCSLAGIVLSYVLPSLFLLLIGVFSIYLTLSGYNFLRVKQVPSAKGWGRFIAVVMALAIVAITILGIDHLQSGKPYGGTILMVFAVLATFLVVQDFRALRSEKFNPIIMHIGRIVGAWISACSAFLVVNQFFSPPILNWLLPTFIGVPAIVYWIRKTRKP